MKAPSWMPVAGLIGGHLLFWGWNLLFLSVLLFGLGPEVLIEIADDGPGMDAEHVSRIFDPFFSTKSTGSGLGLPLTQQVVAEHGGRIACISSPGEGTTFSIRLPVARAPESVSE